MEQQVKDMTPREEGMMESHEIKEGDVFSFQYSAEEYDKASRCGWGGSLRHCFDGQLVALGHDGKISLYDTYWASWEKSTPLFTWGGSSARIFTPEEAVAKGTLKFLFNLADVEAADRSVEDEYDEGDWFDVSTQHGCRRAFAKKKGAKPSKARKLAAVDEKIADARRVIQALEMKIENLEQYKRRIESEPSSTNG